MACCGQGRALVTPARLRPLRPAVDAAPVMLRYLGQRRVEARGAITGRSYWFSVDERTVAVDRRDVVGLLRTGLFRTS
jgi:hypothetical protein